MSDQRTVIVTGAGTGIGNATARRLAADGWRVFATMRRPDMARHGPDALALDVTSDESVASAVNEVMRRTRRIDAIVNNAGIDMVGAAEETSLVEAERLFQTNFFGVHRLNLAVLPIMRAQRQGRIVTVGSIAGFLPTPYNAFYSASKHALKGYTETMQFEVEPLGIKLVLIEPGFIKTDLSGKKVEVADRLDVYAAGRAKATASFDKSVGGGISADKVANVIARALVAGHPKTRQRVGNDAHMLSVIRRFMPESFFRMGLKHKFRQQLCAKACRRRFAALAALADRWSCRRSAPASLEASQSPRWSKDRRAPFRPQRRRRDAVVIAW